MSSHVSPALSRRWQRLPRRLRIVLATKPLAYWSLTVLVAGTVGYAMYSVVALGRRHQGGVRDHAGGGGRGAGRRAGRGRSTRPTPRSVSCRSRWCPMAS